MSNFISVLEKQVKKLSDKTAFIYHSSSASKQASITYSELYLQSCEIGKYLIAKKLTGKKVLLMYPSGIDFILAFFGCLKAAVIPIPVHITKPNRNSWNRLHAIVKNSDAQAILTIASESLTMSAWPEDSFPKALSIIETDTVNTKIENVKWPKIDKNALAFLQYTSGSTGDPKGVVITHQNLIDNAKTVHSAFNIKKQSIVVCWLPHYHDLGLIGNILQVAYAGATCILMNPFSIIKNPIEWLKLISHYKATVSMAPNFIFDLCRTRLQNTEVDNLDLSCLETMINAAEPIRSQTIDQFSQAFATYGFKAKMFRPAYGLAEATLVVTAATNTHGANIIYVDAETLGKNGKLSLIPHHLISSSNTRQLVSSGSVQQSQIVLIVDPETANPLSEGTVGEIWVQGENVAKGFWQNPEETENIFGAFTTTGSGPFLRTGDLGAFLENELYVTGRRKEIIIIRGFNHYPQDLEYTVQNACPTLRKGCGAAFSVEGEMGEEVIIMQEVKHDCIQNANYEDWSAMIFQQIATEHGIALAKIIFVAPNTIPKTSSGKIQRRLCKDWYINKTVKALNIISNMNTLVEEQIRTADSVSATTAQQLCTWLRSFTEKNVNLSLMDSRRMMSPYLVLELGNKGLLGLECKREYGGLELTVNDALSVIKQAGAIDLSLANFLTLQNALINFPLQHCKQNDDQWLRHSATGRLLGAFALTEPAAGSDIRGLQTIAVPINHNQWKIKGEKIWIGNAGWAGYLLVFALRKAENGTPLGISGFIIPSDTPGITIGGEHLTMGLRSMVQNTVYLNDVIVDNSMCLGDLDEGLAIAQRAMMHTRLYIAASTIGAMKRAIQIMVTYTKQRLIAASKLIEMPIIQNKIADSIIKAEAVDQLVNISAVQLDNGHKIPDEIYSICKIAGTENLWQILDYCSQMVGGRGYIESNLIPQLLRDARVLRVFEGPTETLLPHIGSSFYHHPENILYFIKTVLQNEKISKRIAGLGNHWHEKLTNIANDKHNSIFFHIGNVIHNAVVLAAGQQYISQTKYKQQQSPTLRCLEENFEDAIATCEFWTSYESNTFGPETLIEISDSYDKYFGYYKPFAHGEITQVDSLLFPKTKQSINLPQTDISESIFISKVGVNSLNENRITNIINNWFKDKYGQAPISNDIVFARLGMDSITAAELADFLSEKFKCDLEATILWSYPTIAKLADYLVSIIDTENTL